MSKVRIYDLIQLGEEYLDSESIAAIQKGKFTAAKFMRAIPFAVSEDCKDIEFRDASEPK